MSDFAHGREPICTYGQAIYRLIGHFDAHGIQIARDEPLPFVALLVGEIFWINPTRLRRDILRAQRELYFPTASCRRGLK